MESNNSIEIYDIKTLNMLGVECWPNDDGGVWFYHPKTGLATSID